MKPIRVILLLLCLTAYGQRTNSISLNWEWPAATADNYDFELLGSTNLLTWFALAKVCGTNQFNVTMPDPGVMFFKVQAMDRQMEPRLNALRKRTPPIVPPIPKK